MKRLLPVISFLFWLCSNQAISQNKYNISVSLDTLSNTLRIDQQMLFVNPSNDTLNHIYLNDWTFAYTNKNTPLAKRFADEFDRSLHLAKKKERGETHSLILSDRNQNKLNWERIEKQSDVIKIPLDVPIYPGQNYLLRASYQVKIQHNKFTKYGYDKSYKLKNWYLSFSKYNKGWLTYSNLDLDDIQLNYTDYEIVFSYPEAYHLSTNLTTSPSLLHNGIKSTTLKGENITEVVISLTKNNNFKRYQTGNGTLVTNFLDDELTDAKTQLVARRILSFLKKT